MATKKKTEAKGAGHVADLRAKTPDELKDDLLGLKKEQFNLRFQRATQQLEKPTRVREVRREIARVRALHVQQAFLDGFTEQARAQRRVEQFGEQRNDINSHR